MKVVEFLLEKGAKVDQADNEGVTPLSIASKVCLFVAAICFSKDCPFNSYVVFRRVTWKLSNFCSRKAPKLIKRTITTQQLLFGTLLKYEFNFLYCLVDRS